MIRTEKTRNWNGHTLYLQDKQGTWVSEWQNITVPKGKEYNPNEYIDTLYRVVELPVKNTGNENISSKEAGNNETNNTENYSRNTDNGNNPELSNTESLRVISNYGNPESVMTPKNGTVTSNNVINLLSLQNVRYDEKRFTIALDTEFFYEKAENGQGEQGKRNITSYQFACYAYDEIHIFEIVFLIKPILGTDGKKIYKKPTLSLCLGSVLDLCSTFQDKAYEYKDTRRYPVAIRKKSDDDAEEVVQYKMFTSPEEALEGAEKLKKQKRYSDCVIDTSNATKDKYKNVYSDYKGDKAIKITLLCHFGKADLSTFAPERKNGSFLKNLSEVQGGWVSMQDVHFRATHKDYWKFYSCMVQFRDTMCFTSKDKSLKGIGKAVGIPKIQLPKGVIEEMDKFLANDKASYLEYASNDALIALVYASNMWEINHAMPITVSAAAAHGAYQAICDYLEVSSESEFWLAYGGLIKVIKGKTPKANRPGYMDVSNKEPYNHRADLLLSAAAKAYKGGINSCTRTGWFSGRTYYDYDLENAYPTAMCNVFDIDFRLETDPLEYDPICHRELTLADFETPFDPLFADVKFEFPDDCKFPCIPISHEGSLVFPLSSEQAKVPSVFASGPDIYLALKMGAKVTCLDGYRGRIRKRKDGTPSRSLRQTVYQLVKDRNIAKQVYGKDSIEELVLKMMVCSIYGKTAQNVIPKHTWDGMSADYKDLGMSKVTSPIHAAIITSAIRCVLLAAMSQLEALNFSVFSVTTDGFISNAPKRVLDSLDLFGFADYFKEARLFLTDGTDSGMWAAKHAMGRFLNLSTRANVSPDKKAVCAHGNLKTGYISESLNDRKDYIQKTMKRSGRVDSVHEMFPNLKDMIVKGVDFSSETETRRLSFDYDMKRKPVENSFYSVYVNVDSGKFDCVKEPKDGYYEIACFDTVPFSTIAEYELYRSVKECCEVLRTVDDWKKFFVKVKAHRNGKHKIGDYEWSKLMSCIIGYRQGGLSIEPLDKCPNLKAKIEYINRHNTSSKTFTESDWKNARKPDRAGQQLSIEDIQDVLDDLRSGT